jgi:hypothetical protein
MNATATIGPLRTPEEVAELLVHISPFTIRRLVAKRVIAYTPGARAKVLFSEAQIQGLLTYLNVEANPASAEEPEDENLFGTTSRSHARNRQAS